MNRKQLLNKAFQRGHLLNLKNKFYLDWIKRFIIDETKGDIGSIGDITSNVLFKENPVMKAVIKTNQSGIVAGIEEVKYLYSNYRVKVKDYKKDGDKLEKGDFILVLEGKLKDLLKIERSALDLLQRMSGIATLTYNLKKKVKSKVSIAPTRKTQWRYLDKKAVYIGGGLTHRLALWESILIKSDHLKALKKLGVKEPIETALKNSLKNKKTIFLEIEVNNKKNAIKSARAFKKLKSKKPCLIMLDNIEPKKIKEIIKELKRIRLYNNILIEASGGITPKNIKEYAKTGVDVVSLGYLTHSVKILDMSHTIVD